MGRKKNPENKDRIEAFREKLSESRQNFVAPQTEECSDVKTAFSEFWVRSRKEYNRPRELEDVLWAHIKSAGFDSPELFEEGLAHFGLKK